MYSFQYASRRQAFGVIHFLTYYLTSSFLFNNSTSEIMKKFIFLFLFAGLLSFAGFSQTDDSVASEKETTELTEASEVPHAEKPNVQDAVNELIQVITNNPDVNITLPDKLDTKDQNSINNWYGFLVALLAPIITFIVSFFWPSFTKGQLIAKSLGAVILLVIVFISMKGEVNYGDLMQVFIGLVGNVFSYDKLYKPMGLESRRKVYKE